MLRTIVTGTCISVQGEYVADAPGGFVTVRVGENLHTGRPVSPPVRPARAEDRPTA